MSATKNAIRDSRTSARGARQASAASDPRTHRYAEFVDLFYPVHYRLGMTIEAAMCDGVVSRTQAAILWLVAREVDADGNILRKHVERQLRQWYETSNSNISKLLRDLAKPPLEFIVQRESAHSGREKVISLTPKGRKFFDGMRARGVVYFEHALRHMPSEVMQAGSLFFSSLFSVPLTPADTGMRVTARRNGKSRAGKR